MILPLTQTTDNGHRNSSLLGAFALVLAFAFGVGTTATPTTVVGQQLLPADVGLPLLADIDTSFDIAISVAPATFAVPAGRQPAPQSGHVLPVATSPLAAFLARAPPV